MFPSMSHFFGLHLELHCSSIGYEYFIIRLITLKKRWKTLIWLYKRNMFVITFQLMFIEETKLIHSDSQRDINLPLILPSLIERQVPQFNTLSYYYLHIHFTVAN